MKIGVLALQGSVKEHIESLKRCSVEPVEVRKPEDLDDIYGLIIPGGESTTIGKLISESGLDKEIVRKHQYGMSIYGTCAGAILLARNIIDNRQPKLGLMDISVKRNDYGGQIDSFEVDLDIEGFAKPFRGVFIRAPTIKSFNGVKILSTFNDNPVLIRQDQILISTFHPELTDDIRIHKYFVDMVKKGPEF